MITKKEIESRIQKKVPVNKIMTMYFELMAKNIVNGYLTPLTKDLSIMAKMHYNPDPPPVSLPVLLETGEKKRNFNEHYPNHTLKIKLYGSKARGGYVFKASKKLSKQASDLAYQGHKFEYDE